MNQMTRVDAPAKGNPLMPETVDQAVRLAKIMSEMSLVPGHLQGKPADCMLVIEQAHRWGMSPFAVAQATSVLQGKLNFEGKLVAAALQTSGLLATRLRYDYRGEGKDRAVLVSAVVAGETEPRDVLVELSKVATQNKMWASQPDQQLAYAGARIWARRHAPEVMLGVYAPEEFEPAPEPRHVESRVVQPEPKRAAPKPQRPEEYLNDAIPDFDAPTPAPAPKPVPSGVPQGADPAGQWARKMVRKIEACTTEEEMHAIAGDAQLQEDRRLLVERDGRKDLDDQIAAAFGAAYERLRERTETEAASAGK